MMTNKNFEARTKAAQDYKEEREQCKNPDGTPYKTTHAQITAFLCGWDSHMEYIKASLYGGEKP